MRYLIDTHVFIWFIEENENISIQAKQLIESNKDVYISVASIWEIAIKAKLNKLKLNFPFNQILEKFKQKNIRVLDITSAHTLKIYQLEDHHKDPFDRIMIAQALCDDFVLVTNDKQITKYNVNTIF